MEEEKKYNEVVYNGSIVCELLPKDWNATFKYYFSEIEGGNEENYDPVENNNKVEVINATIKVVNMILLNLNKEIEDISEKDKQDYRNIYDQVLSLDKQVGTIINDCFKIKQREKRKFMIDTCQKFLERSRNMISILRDTVLNKENITLERIAKLNDLAYKGVRKTGLRKMLNERAMYIEENYKIIDEQISEVVSKFDFSKIEEEHKEIIERVGECL